jgi:hypothetical protein
MCVCCDSYTTVVHFHTVETYGLLEVDIRPFFTSGPDWEGGELSD